MSALWSWLRPSAPTRRLPKRQVKSFCPRIEALEERRALATFTVINTNNSGDGSLRWAIQQANLDSARDTIQFNIRSSGLPVYLPTINLSSELPTITQPVTLDATTQYGGRVELNGANAVGSSIKQGPIQLPGQDQADGLYIKGTDSTIKGLVINRFSGNGVVLAGGGFHDLQSCLIGTNKYGLGDLGNGRSGVLVTSGGNTIGGITTSQGNVIAGNQLEGIRITGSAAIGNWILGNRIGTDTSGVATPNLTGVAIESAGNHVGATNVSVRNTISGNNIAGVHLLGASASGNVIIGSYIGTDASGTTAVGNGIGIWVHDAPNNVIGGTGDGGRNVISGNHGNGISISGANASGNAVRGNFIGLDYTGNVPLPNHDFGINIESAPNNTIGGVDALGRNIISGNNKIGVFITGASGSTVGNRILGNYIGTDVTGSVARANPLAGIWIQNATGVIIGGTETGARNVISGNGQGVHIAVLDDVYPGNHQIVGNFIGTDANGVGSLGNVGHGVYLAQSGNLVGGTAAGAGNVIAYNGGSGITVEEGTGNAFIANLIYANGVLPIDLGNDGLTPNDLADGDTGANNLQNAPVLTAANRTATSVTISGSLNSLPNTTFDIEIFATKADGRQVFVGRIRRTTNGAGNDTFNVTFNVPLAAGDLLTATATRLVDDDGNAATPLISFETSELSNGIAV